MISVLAVAVAAITVSWLPRSQHARTAAFCGRRELPPDELVVEWVKRHRRPHQGQPLTTQLLQSVIGELHAGAIPADACLAVLGSGTPEALLNEPPTVDVHVWRDVAAIWSAAERAGFSMATALQRVHSNALIDQEIAREVRSNVAAPKFSIVTMALLPIAVWGMGSTFGANPLHFLLTNPVGWACLVLGTGLFGLAAYVVRRMITSAMA